MKTFITADENYGFLENEGILLDAEGSQRVIGTSYT